MRYRPTLKRFYADPKKPKQTKLSHIIMKGSNFLLNLNIWTSRFYCARFLTLVLSLLRCFSQFSDLSCNIALNIVKYYQFAKCSESLKKINESVFEIIDVEFFLLKKLEKKEKFCNLMKWLFIISFCARFFDLYVH